MAKPAYDLGAYLASLRKKQQVQTLKQRLDQAVKGVTGEYGISNPELLASLGGGFGGSLLGGSITHDVPGTLIGGALGSGLGSLASGYLFDRPKGYEDDLKSRLGRSARHSLLGLAPSILNATWMARRGVI